MRGEDRIRDVALKALAFPAIMSGLVFLALIIDGPHGGVRSLLSAFLISAVIFVVFSPAFLIPAMIRHQGVKAREAVGDLEARARRRMTSSYSR